MKTIGYIRVSSEDQANSGLSLAHQKARIEAYTVATDLDLVCVIEDAGKSAKNLNREGMQKALEMIRKGEARALIVLKLDRLTRSVKDLGTLVETFDKTGAALISVQDSINTQTAAGRLVINLLGSVAQWEREAIGERTAAALSVKKGRMEKTGGDTPFGYDVVEGQLIPNHHEQEAIKTMKKLKGRGYSLRAIGEELLSCGFNAKNGGQWYPKTISRILVAQA